MTLADQIIAEARKCMGTPYKHQGRRIGLGLDCIGLIIHVAKTLNIKSRTDPRVDDYMGYKRVPYKDTLTRILDEHMIRIEEHEMMPGDVVCTTMKENPHHVGIVAAYPSGGLSIIHAAMHNGKVVESRLTYESMKFVAAYRYPRVTHG
jgi:cell wall-associated NlpC family hydrolase